MKIFPVYHFLVSLSFGFLFTKVTCSSTERKQVGRQVARPSALWEMSLSAEDVDSIFEKMLYYKYREECEDNLFRNNRIKLIAIDVDGTLANSKSEIDDTTLTVMKEVEKQGIKVIIATGRLYKDVESLFTEEQKKKYKIKDINGIFAHGAYFRINGRNYIYKSISKQNLEYVYIAGLKYNILNYIVIITDTEQYIYNTSDYIEEHIYETEELDENNKPVRRAKVDSLIYDPIVVDNVSSLFNRKNVISVEIVEQIFPEQRSFNELFSGFKDAMEHYFKVYEVHGYSLLVLSPFNSSKMSALAVYTRLLGVDFEQTLAIGNDHNDRDMIIASKYGIAVENAIIPLKHAANCVSTRSNDNYAVANTLLKVLKGRLAKLPQRRGGNVATRTVKK